MQLGLKNQLIIFITRLTGRPGAGPIVCSSTGLPTLASSCIALEEYITAFPNLQRHITCRSGAVIKSHARPRQANGRVPRLRPHPTGGENPDNTRTMSSIMHLQRRATWPSARKTSSSQDISKPESPLAHSTLVLSNNDTLFEADLNKNPDAHFITQSESMEYRYQYNWSDDDSDDDDDDDQDFQWNAGITDFALFDNDRRAAQEAHQQLPTRWNDMLLSQSDALQRAAQRTQSNDFIPALTPDTSPHLADDMEPDTVPVPNYLTITLAPPTGHTKQFNDDDELPLQLLNPHATLVKSTRNFLLQRPGLRHTRTLSGKAHSWRRPGWELYSVGEDVDAERRAELDFDLDLDPMSDLDSPRGRR